MDEGSLCLVEASIYIIVRHKSEYIEHASLSELVTFLASRITNMEILSKQIHTVLSKAMKTEDVGVKVGIKGHSVIKASGSIMDEPELIVEGA